MKAPIARAIREDPYAAVPPPLPVQSNRGLADSRDKKLADKKLV